MKKSRKIRMLPEIAGAMVLAVTMFWLHNLYAATGVTLAMIFISSTLDRVRNKLGSNVFSRNHHGDFMRARVKPRNPKTAAQMTSRGAFTQMSRQWRTLTPLMHQTWNRFGQDNPVTNQLGVQYTLSGFHWFMKVNIPLYYTGQEIKLTPCVINNLVLPEYGKCNVEYDKTTQELKGFKLDYKGTDMQENVVFEVFMSQQISSGITSALGVSFRYSCLIPRDSVPNGQIDLMGAIAKTAGLWKSNSKNRIVYFKIRQVNLQFGTSDPWQYVQFRIG